MEYSRAPGVDPDGAPPRLQESRDWRCRAYWYAAVMHPRYRHDLRRFDGLLCERMWFTSFQYPLSSDLDVAYARRPEEYHYAGSLCAWSEETQRVEDNLPHVRLLFYTTPRVLSGRRDLPVSHTPETGLTTQRLVSMPDSWARFERTMRSRTGAFITAQYREVVAIEPFYIPLKYRALPPEWYQLEAPWCL